MANFGQGGNEIYSGNAFYLSFMERYSAFDLGHWEGVFESTSGKDRVGGSWPDFCQFGHSRIHVRSGDVVHMYTSSKVLSSSREIMNIESSGFDSSSPRPETFRTMSANASTSRTS